MLNVLWLCSWYPNKLNIFDGDFIQRHARAASQHHLIYVIRLVPNEKGNKIVRDIIKNKEYPNLAEDIIYYPKNLSAIGKLKSYYLWYLIFKMAVKQYIIKNNLPDLVHAHIPFKAGLIAQWIKRKYKVPYVVTEHWGIYNNIAKDNFNTRPRWFKNVVKGIFKNASGIHSVSEYLLAQVNLVVNLNNKSSIIIPNVVDTHLFYLQHKNAREFEFIHISNGDAVKNVQGIIDAYIEIASEKMQLKIIGLPSEMNNSYQLKYPQIIFTGKLNYDNVANEMKNANALVMFSNIENSPCVIGEALCCGVPVIATKVGGIPEIVNETNGLLIEPGNIKELSKAFLNLQNNYKDYNRHKISENAKNKFSYPVIGSQLDNWYKIILENQIRK